MSVLPKPRSRGRFSAINTNMDNSPPAAFYTFLNKHMPQAPWGVIREGFKDGPKNVTQPASFTTTVARMNLPWIPRMWGGLLWQANLEEVDPFPGPGDLPEGSDPLKKFGIQPGPEGDARVWHPTDKPINARWRVAAAARALPNACGDRGLWGILGPNEADLNAERVCWLHNIYDANTTNEQRAEVMQHAVPRFIALAKALYEELRGPSMFLERPHEAIIFSCTMTEYGMQRSPAAHKLRFRTMLFHNDGEWNRYVDAWAFTFHHNPGYWVEAPAIGDRSVANVWASLKEFYSTFPDQPRRPVCFTEFGIGSQHRTLDGPGEYPFKTKNQWQSDGTNYWPADGVDKATNGKQVFRTYKIGMHCLYAWYWAVSLVSHYALGMSGADHREDGTIAEKGSYEGPYGTQNYMDWKHSDPATGEGIPFEPAWSTLQMLWDVDRYRLPADGVVPIVAKGWKYDPTDVNAGFHIPWSWAVCVKVFDYPLGYSPAADNVVTMDMIPWPEWQTVSVADNLITSGPSTGLTKRICRPVLLSINHGTWRLRCEARCSGGGAAVLIARGYDALAGDAYVQSSQAGVNWTPLECVFTTNPHNVRRLPNAAKVVVVLRHNGIGTAEFRNVTITPV